MNESTPNKDSRLLKTYMPAVAMLFITVTVMLYFKSTQDGGYNIFDHGGSLLERFYSKNLMPFFESKEQLSNEDLINFAFNNNLPVSEDKVLFINERAGFGPEIGVKEAIVNRDTKNYEKFINLYCKDDISQARIDSILEYYRADLTASVLTSENQAMVIDESIIDLNRALKTELLDCAQKSLAKSYTALEKKHLITLDAKKLEKYKQLRKEKDDTKFLFLTPDTVFTRDYKYDKSKVVKILEIPQTQKWNEELKDVIVPLPAIEGTENISQLPGLKEFSIDKRKISAIYAAEKMHHISLRDSLKKMTQALEKLQKESLGTFSFGFNNDSAKINFELNFDELGEFIFQTLNAVGEQSAKNWEDFGLKIDSAASVFEQSVIDSLIKASIKKNEAEKRMKKIRKKNK